MAAIELYYTPLFSYPSLISYYRMEGNSNDSKGSNNGTDTSMSYSLADGKFDQGAGLSGSGYITIGDIAAMRFTMASAFSLVFWFRTTSTAAQSYIGKADALGAGNGYRAKSVTSGTKLGFDIYNTAGAGVTVTGATTVNDGTYHLGVTTYDGSGNSSGMKVYVDGSLDASGSGTGDLTGTLDAGDPFMIGAREGGSQKVTGAMDDCAVFSSELTAANVSDLWTGVFPATTNPAFLLNFV